MSAFLLAFREAIEAGLAISLALVVTRGVRWRELSVCLGVAAGLLGAGLLAWLAEELSSLFGEFEKSVLDVLLLSGVVVMLARYHSWLARQGTDLVNSFSSTGGQIKEGRRSIAVLFGLIVVVVLRETLELALLLHGLVVSDMARQELGVHAVLGLGAGILVSALGYVGRTVVSIDQAFRITGILFVLVAAKFAAEAARIVTDMVAVAFLTRPLWSTSWLAADGSVVGQALHELVGYTDHPSLVQLAAYVSVATLMCWLMRTGGRGTTAAHTPT